MIKAHFPLPYLNKIGLRGQKRKWRGEEDGWDLNPISGEEDQLDHLTIHYTYALEI